MHKPQFPLFFSFFQCLLLPVALFELIKYVCVCFCFIGSDAQFSHSRTVTLRTRDLEDVRAVDLRKALQTQVSSPDRQQEHHGGTWYKCNLQIPTQDLLDWKFEVSPANCTSTRLLVHLIRLKDCEPLAQTQSSLIQTFVYLQAKHPFLALFFTSKCYARMSYFPPLLNCMENLCH